VERIEIVVDKKQVDDLHSVYIQDKSTSMKFAAYRPDHMVSYVLPNPWANSLS
jgi:hypothetical protein